ncbi:DNA repair protein rad50 [Coemansia sp. RSA 2050]|nr:DNA repair protein rad50 [Coemansia sp. RSA 2050]KAJ2736576.1 DNA repair protein rad50 [Coemansia sp. BCRC 34962]
MSVIRKLLIQGVRSFDPQNQDIIEFYAPLTIIVGQNGCGKTTIIECLKYITTGELPPNSKGGAFIHDPKLAGETEVKAQVKLRFNNVSQRSMTCVRSMLLSQKKATVTQKTLEGALSFDATATEDKVSISSRCADLDAMLPEQLGVSKAVLENVIFCHQEESNWPLSEASVLKKKFDEIFAATRYTKALESIKTIRKGQVVEIRVQRGELKHLEEKKTKSERVRTEYEKSTVAIHEYKTRIDGIQRQEEQVAAQLDGLAVRLQEFMALNTTVQGLKMSLDEKIASYREMEANTRVLEVSDEELQCMGADIQRKIESQGGDNQRRHMERDKLQQQHSAAQREIDDLLSEIGRLQAARNSLESLVASRAATIAETISSVSLSSSSSQDADRQAEDCAAQIEMRLSHAEAERVETRRHAEARERELQAEINAVQSQIYDLNNVATLSEKGISFNLLEIRGMKEKHDALQPDVASIKRTEDELVSEKSLLETAQAQDSERVYSEMAKQKRLELVGLADEIARLNSEIARNNLQADTRAKLALRRSELEGKQARRDELASNSELARYMPSSGQDQSRSALIKGAVEAKKQELAEWNVRCKDHSSELANKRMRLDMAIDAMSKKEGEMSATENEIYIECSGGEYEETVSAIQSELQAVLEAAGHYKSASSMYKAYIQKVETDHTCPVCQRGWSNKADEDKLVSKLKLDYTSAPTELLQLDKEVKDYEKQLSKLHGLRSRASDLEGWKAGGKKELEDQIKELARSVQDLKVWADDGEAGVAQLSSDLKALTELLAKSDELEELEKACGALARQIEIHEHELQATGSIKTADELQREIAAHQAQESAVRRELDRLGQEHIIKQKELGFRQDNIRRLQEALSELSRQADERAALLVRIAELERANAGLEAEGQVAREKAGAVGPQLQQGMQRLADFRGEARGQESLIDQRVRDLTQCKDQLAMISREISNARAQLSCAAGEHRYADRLEQAQAQKKEQQERMLQLSARLDAIVTELRESERIAAQLVTTQREISDNVRLRANRCDQERLNAELKDALGKQAQLESQLSQIYDDGDNDNDSGSDCEMMDGSPHKRRRDGSAAGSGRSRGGVQLQRRRDVLHGQLSRLASERAGLQGETKQLEDQARRLAHELSTDYRDVEQLFVKQLVLCKTEELANEDLETYGKALDSAIMRYHSLKMQDINKIIRELWINTYQGNDIDTIEIRSEMEGARNSRSHNYRVVMIKGGHAIDMRGRCSAGQKVLACLIIRLALAETFSVNCGILALDEPTTNLDQENIDSLARSLARIIKSRQEQRNFQLIVITHDEIFMQLLGKSEYADYYWRVYKDENQCSVFARRPIANS